MIIGTAPNIVPFLATAPVVISSLTALSIFIFELSEIEKPSENYFISLAWRLITNLGLCTYALYVWHEPILTSLRKATKLPINLSHSIENFILGFLLVLLIGGFFYRKVELQYSK